MLQVLYVANAEVLIDGGFYSFNEAAGGWDTPQAAQYILHNLLASHQDALAALKTADGARSLAEVRTTPSARYLQGPAVSMLRRLQIHACLSKRKRALYLQVASEGVESTVHAMPVDAALAVLEGLHGQSEVRISLEKCMTPDGRPPEI